MDAAYVAGILDGEGCLSIGANKRKRIYDARVYLGMTAKALALLQSIHRQFGGTLRRSRMATKKWAEAWMWCLCGQETIPFLENVEPSLQLKRTQAVCLLELEIMKAGKRMWTEDMRTRAAELREAVMTHNRRGPSDLAPPLPGMIHVRLAADGERQKRQPDLFDDTGWEPFSGRFGTAGISGPGGCWMRSISDSPSDDGEFSACSLASILETEASYLEAHAGATVADWLDYVRRFYRSPAAAAGILRRAARRGKTLPPPLHAALEALAASEPMPSVTEP